MCKKDQLRILENFFPSKWTDGFTAYCRKCDLIRNKKYVKKHKKEVAKYKDGWAKDNSEKCKKAAKKYKNWMKLEVFQHYSNSKTPYCKCCKINIFDFMTIDHINGDGAKHRKTSTLRGLTLYRYLYKQKYPKGYQILCYNCNSSKKTGTTCIGHNKYLGK